MRHHAGCYEGHTLTRGQSTLGTSSPVRFMTHVHKQPQVPHHEKQTKILGKFTKRNQLFGLGVSQENLVTRSLWKLESWGGFNKVRWGWGCSRHQGWVTGPCLGRWRRREASRVINLETWLGGPAYSALGTTRNHLGHGLLTNRASLVALW